MTVSQYPLVVEDVLGDVQGNVDGSVDSVTQGTGLSASGIDAIWDEPDAGHTTTNTPGNTLRLLDDGSIVVASVTANVGVSGLAQTALDDIWDEPDAGHTTANTPGNTLRLLDDRLPGSGTLSTLTSIVDSIQEGTVTISGTNGTGTATISAIVVARTFLINTGINYNADTQDHREFDVWLELTNTTTITARRIGSVGAGILVRFFAVELL